MAWEPIDRATLDPEHTVVVATGNAHKLVEIETMLSAALPSTRFVALSQLGQFEDPEETGTTFEENALIKVRAAVAEFPEVPIICEGHVHTPADVRAALDAGAWAVVVGTAITHPTTITSWFAAETGE